MTLFGVSGALCIPDEGMPDDALDTLFMYEMEAAYEVNEDLAKVGTDLHSAFPWVERGPLTDGIFTMAALRYPPTNAGDAAMWVSKVFPADVLSDDAEGWENWYRGAVTAWLASPPHVLFEYLAMYAGANHVCSHKCEQEHDEYEDEVGLADCKEQCPTVPPELLAASLLAATRSDKNNRKGIACLLNALFGSLDGSPYASMAVTHPPGMRALYDHIKKHFTRGEGDDEEEYADESKEPDGFSGATEKQYYELGCHARFEFWWRTLAQNSSASIIARLRRVSEQFRHRGWRSQLDIMRKTRREEDMASALALAAALGSVLPYMLVMPHPRRRDMYDFQRLNRRYGGFIKRSDSEVADMLFGDMNGGEAIVKTMRFSVSTDINAMDNLGEFWAALPQTGVSKDTMQAIDTIIYQRTFGPFGNDRNLEGVIDDGYTRVWPALPLQVVIGTFEPPPCYWMRDHRDFEPLVLPVEVGRMEQRVRTYTEALRKRFAKTLSECAQGDGQACNAIRVWAKYAPEQIFRIFDDGVRDDSMREIREAAQWVKQWKVPDHDLILRMAKLAYMWNHYETIDVDEASLSDPWERSTLLALYRSNELTPEEKMNWLSMLKKYHSGSVDYCFLEKTDLHNWDVMILALAKKGTKISIDSDDTADVKAMPEEEREAFLLKFAKLYAQSLVMFEGIWEDIAGSHVHNVYEAIPRVFAMDDSLKARMQRTFKKALRETYTILMGEVGDEMIRKKIEQGYRAVQEKIAIAEQGEFWRLMYQFD